MLDCGLASAELGLSLHQLSSVSELTLINSGGLAEQLVGQQLRTLFPPFVPPSLNYWQRTEVNANAEVDYVIQHRDQVVPVEVKAGSTGTLKSLHQFMESKGRSLAVRINSDYPTFGLVQVKTTTGSKVEYTLLPLPFYLLVISIDFFLRSQKLNRAHHEIKNNIMRSFALEEHKRLNKKHNPISL